MNTHTGEIVHFEALAAMPTERRKEFVEVKRDLTAKERSDKQIRMYSPCGCGSGKKFKWCCHRP